MTARISTIGRRAVHSARAPPIPTSSEAFQLGTYLTDEQIARIQQELTLVYSIPYASDLIGTAWEQILSDVKGGRWSSMRDNRPRPDMVVTALDGTSLNYSIKTEGLRPTGARSKAKDFLGHHEDFIVARPKVDELLAEGETIDTLAVGDLGKKVLQYYNTQIVERYRWHVLSFLLRVSNTEFIYWEEKPIVRYDPADYWWRESGRATGSNRNINGFPNTVSRETTTLPRAKFKWTSGGKQFYVLYEIPQDADTWEIERTALTLEDLRTALRELMKRKKEASEAPDVT